MSDAASDVLLDARGLGRALGRAGDREGGVRDVTLALRGGDVLGLLGLNGAGKSTTLKLFAGVLAPDAGSVSIAGHPMEDEPLTARARLGYLPDVPPLYPELGVGSYLGLCARLRRLRGAAARAAVERVIERCDLGAVRGRRIATLSKGYRQRVGLAQALVHEPDVLLLDEPGSGLDPRQTEELRRLVGEVGRERRCVVFSTHLLHEVRSVCNRVAIVHEGRLVAERALGGGGGEGGEGSGEGGGADLDALFAGLARGAPTAAAGTDRVDGVDGAGASAPPDADP